MSRKFGLPGKVYFIASDADSADSLTARANEILQQAEVVLHDDLVASSVLERAPKSALVLNVAQAENDQITERLMAFAEDGKTVVRIVLLASTASRQTQDAAQALRQSGIAVDVEPGLQAPASAAAA